MGTLFTCPSAPSAWKRVPCSSPSMGLTCTAEERCGYCEDGWEDAHTTEAPECNFSEVNAADLLRLLGLTCDCYGEIPADQVSAVLRRVLRALNVESDRAALVAEPFDGRSTEHRVIIHEGNLARLEVVGGCRVVSFGNTDEQTLRRLSDLRSLLVYAADHNYSVTWA